MLFAGIDHDFAVVLQQINAQWPGITVIGCTTDGEMSSHILVARNISRNRPGHTRVAKPFNAHELLARVNTHLPPLAE
jgi:DNA-binding response OmpR family regulator